MTDNSVEHQDSGIHRLHRSIETGKSQRIALMSHAVVGYPSIEHNRRSIAALINAGADLMELQFPFSDPLADGPILTHANQTAVQSGITVDDCFAFSAEITATHSNTAFVLMTYLNLIYRRGMQRFIGEAARAGVAAIIVPDLPPDQSDDFRKYCEAVGLGTVFLATPLSDENRLDTIANLTTGFVYCVGRPGVSGESTAFDDDMLAFISRVRQASRVPVGVGFGIRTPHDVEILGEVCDLAIVCTEAIRRIDADGIDSTADYIKSLR